MKRENCTEKAKPDGEHGRHYLPAGAKPYLQTLMHCCGLSLCGVLMLLRRVVGDRRPWVEHRSRMAPGCFGPGTRRP